MQNYISELRGDIGHRPLIMVGSTLVALNKDGKILMLKRNDNGFWGMPGGGMELGESLEDTVRREAKEEAGIEVKELEFFKVFSGPEFHYIYPNGDEVYMVTAVYLTHLSTDEVKIGLDEHNDYGFFDLADLPEGISPTILRILKELSDQQQKGSKSESSAF